MYLVRTPVEDSVQILGSVDINLADFGEDEPKHFNKLLSDSQLGFDAHLSYQVKGTAASQVPKKPKNPKTLADQQTMHEELKRLRAEHIQLEKNHQQVVNAFEDTLLKKKKEIAKTEAKIIDCERDSSIVIAEAKEEIERLRQEIENKNHLEMLAERQDDPEGITRREQEKLDQALWTEYQGIQERMALEFRI